MPSRVVVGAQWGDEGKGKVVDVLAAESDVVVRSQGGNNAGHTIKTNNKTYKLKAVPSGILFPNVCCYIGAGVVINPESILDEIKELKNEGVSFENFKIDNRANIITPWHIAIDNAEEKIKDKNKIGTTKKGIGPCYCDKFKRIGIRMHDLIDEAALTEKLKYLGNYNNKLLTKLYEEEALSVEKIASEYLEFGKKLKVFVADVSELVYNDYKAKKNILFEGAQGTMLDIDHGTFPFVTSSNPIAGGVCTGVGFSPTKIDEIIGVCKAYTTRVGKGPFPSEITNNVGDLIREKGAEFGTNTKRKRRIGWFDAVVLRHSKIVNGFNKIVLNKLDILQNINPLKICVGYKTKNEEILKSFPASINKLDEITPIFEEMPGFSEDISNCKTVEELPSNCKKYILKLEEVCRLKIEMIGTGPERHQNIKRYF